MYANFNEAAIVLRLLPAHIEKEMFRLKRVHHGLSWNNLVVDIALVLLPWNDVELGDYEAVEEHLQVVALHSSRIMQDLPIDPELLVC